MVKTKTVQKKVAKRPKMLKSSKSKVIAVRKPTAIKSVDKTKSKKAIIVIAKKTKK